MGKKEEQYLIDLTRKIMRSYYAENRLDLLFDAMAEDIVWLGPTKPMRAEGREKVKTFFLDRQSSMFACDISNEFALARPLGKDYYFVETSHDVEAKNTELYTIRECCRATYIYRRVAQERQDKWEIVHINSSVAWSKLAEKELFAKQAAEITRRSFQKQPPNNAREQTIVNLLRHGLSNREIAMEMNIAEITVKKALSKLYRRYGVNNRAGLITFFSTKD